MGKERVIALENEERKWLVLVEAPPDQKAEDLSPESMKLINLDMVRHIDQITPTHVRLHFSETHKVEIHGGGAGELVLTLMSRGITTGGIPYPKVDATSES